MEQPGVVAGNFGLSFSLNFFSIFVHISGYIRPIWASLERSFPPAEVEYRWCQFLVKSDDGPPVTGGIGVNGLIFSILDHPCSFIVCYYLFGVLLQYCLQASFEGNFACGPKTQNTLIEPLLFCSAFNIFDNFTFVFPSLQMNQIIRQVRMMFLSLSFHELVFEYFF